MNVRADMAFKTEFEIKTGRVVGKRSSRAKVSVCLCVCGGVERARDQYLRNRHECLCVLPS